MSIVIFFLSVLFSSSFSEPRGSEWNFSKDNANSCLRPCQDTNRICSYEFVVEEYMTLSDACKNCPTNPADCLLPECIAVDGFPKKVKVVNRQMPGPKIEVCEGDEVSVIVRNKMLSDTTSIHWHGLHQVGTPYMDGVPFVTQCPILRGQTYEYRFRASESGTHFWHSHSKEMQKGAGLFGALIVREKIDHRQKQLYDFDYSEHTIVLSDWTPGDAHDSFIKLHFAAITEQARSILVNGLGRYTNLPSGTENVPTPRFIVKQGYRYRFRFISAVFTNSYILCTFDGHPFTVISSDGVDIKPIITDTFTIYAGERYDVVIHANQTKGLYWMRFQGSGQIKQYKVHQATVLQYDGQSNTAYPEGVPTYEAAIPTGRMVNAESRPPNNIPVNEFRSIATSNYGGRPDQQIYIVFNYTLKYDPKYQLSQPYEGDRNILLSALPQLNDISLKLFSFPLLSQRDQLTRSSFCNASANSPTCEEGYCECPHVIQIKKNALVEIIFIDKGGALFTTSHPIHLHGHYFVVVGSDRFGSTSKQAIIDLDAAGKLSRNFKNPPFKDSVAVPNGGYLITRFFAKNPGFWFLHCHAEVHLDLGMGMVFQVGEFRDFPPVPKKFPICGDFLEAPEPPAMKY